MQIDHMNQLAEIIRGLFYSCKPHFTYHADLRRGDKIAPALGDLRPEDIFTVPLKISHSKDERIWVVPAPEDNATFILWGHENRDMFALYDGLIRISESGADFRSSKPITDEIKCRLFRCVMPPIILACRSKDNWLSIEAIH